MNETTSIAKLNPGLDVHGKNHLNPPLIGKPDPGLVDYIVKEKLFTFFLNNGCIPFTKEHALVERMVNSNPWAEPIRVYGYDDSWAVAWVLSFVLAF